MKKGKRKWMEIREGLRDIPPVRVNQMEKDMEPKVGLVIYELRTGIGRKMETAVLFWIIVYWGYYRDPFLHSSLAEVSG